MASEAAIPLNCPRCRRQLRYLRDTDDGFPLYVCVERGWFVIGAGGRLQDLLHPPERSH